MHTASDSLTSLVVVAAAYLARKPPDREHPFGHGRSEAIGAVVIAVLLAVVGVELGKESVLRIANPQEVTAPAWIIIAVLFTAAIKEWLSRYALFLGRRSGNSAVTADAWHHRSDVFATVLVAVGMVGARLGAPWLDGAAGALVCMLLLWVAYTVARESIDTLIGAAPDRAEIERVKRLAAEVDGVAGVHDVVLHRYGARVFLSLHVETSHLLDAETLHRIANAVEQKVQVSEHGSVCVHVDPVNVAHPRYDEVSTSLDLLVKNDPDTASFHDLRLVGDPRSFSIVFDLQLAEGVRNREGVRSRLHAELTERFPEAHVVIEVDPEFSY